MENKIKIINEKFYTLQEVAKLFRVSERSIFRYIHSGKLKASKIGYWRIMGNDIRDFLSDGLTKEYIKEARKSKRKK
ncbi:MAG: helix-turn-helix domain-containing protein [Candidatus Staskawiczbacteria bacterium]|nr:helix-turn-helix domain-containing protein [Candidatus Staskawiczbacteria bacterium]